MRSPFSETPMQRPLFSSRPRRAQALILAVLVMVLAALLGATFVTIVALNLNQTARQSEKSAAFQSAQAGLNYVNQQLTKSEDGAEWFLKNYDDLSRPNLALPEDASNPSVLRVVAANPDYFTSLEESQDWKGKFIKFPDPNTPASADAPQFLARVQRILVGVPDGVDATDPDYADPSKRGMLRITTIGISNESNAYSKLVAYKPTALNGGPFSFVRYDSNTDTTTNSLVEARSTAAVASTATTIPIDDSQGFTIGRTIMVSERGKADSVGVVKAVTPTSIELAAAISPAPANVSYLPNASVRAVSSLYDGLLGIDADGSDPATPVDATETPLREVTNAATKAEVQINQGLVLQGKSNLILNSAEDAVRVDGRVFRATTATEGTLASTTPSASSTFPDSNNAPPSPDALQRRVFSDEDVTSTDPTRPKKTSSVSPFDFAANVDRYRELTQKADPAKGSQQGHGRNLYIDNRADFEKVSNGGTGFVRLTSPQLHRLWQRKSFQVPTATGGNVSYPAGGLYPANSIVAGGTNTNTYRLAFPRLGAVADTYIYPTPTAGSLEQRAIRGWVSPWEFRPRGVTIDLRGNTILITRDDRSDSSGANYDFTKSWRDADGNLLGAGLGDRVFRVQLDLATGDRYPVVDETNIGSFAGRTPISTGNGAFEGIIFAEGNVRVRGWYSNTLKPLTIVSGNNIYIDGTLRKEITAKKISLIAKQNVVLNPGQFTPRSAGVGDADIALADENANDGSDPTVRQQIKLTADLNSNANAISCTPQTANTPLNFKIGDRIVVGTYPEVLTVTSVNALTGQIGVRTSGPTLTSIPTGQQPAGARVRLLQEAPVVAGKDPVGKVPPLFPNAEPTRQTNEYFYRLSRPWHALARDIRFDNVPLPTGSYGYYLSGTIAGERVTGLNIRMDNVTTTTDGSTPPIRPASANVVVKENPAPDDNTKIENHFRTTPPPSVLIREKIFELQRGATGTDAGWQFGPYDLLDLNPGGAIATDDSEDLAALKVLGSSYRKTPSTDSRWTLTTPATLAGFDPFDNVPARLLSYFKDPASFASNTTRDVPLTSAVGFYWSRNASPNLTAVNPTYRPIGARRDRLDGEESGELGTGADSNKAELTRFVDSRFYERLAPDGTFRQRELRWLTPANGYVSGLEIFNSADSVANKPAPSEVSSLVYRPFPLHNSLPLPALRVGPSRLERSATASLGPFGLPGTTPLVPDADFTPHQIAVEAHVYAHEGSWFVIPEAVQAPLDENAEPTEDAVTEVRLATRTRRLNYQIAFKGTIAQNFSPTADLDYDNEPDPDSLAEGATKRWLDSLAVPTKVDREPTFNIGADWQSITYASDPFLPTDDVSALPLSPDLIYQD